MRASQGPAVPKVPCAVGPRLPCEGEVAQPRAGRCGRTGAAHLSICRASGARPRRYRERWAGRTTGAAESDLTSPKGHSPEPEVLAPPFSWPR